MYERSGHADRTGVRADAGLRIANPLELGVQSEQAFKLPERAERWDNAFTKAINTARPGGEVVLVGVPRMDVFLNLNAAFTWLYLAKTIKGCWYGSSNVYEDVPKLLELWRNGDLKLKELISQEIDNEHVNEAFEDMKAGTVARSVIVHQHG